MTGVQTCALPIYYITKQHLALVNFMLGKSNSFIYNTISKRLDMKSGQTYIGSTNLFNNYNKIEMVDWIKLNCVATDNSIAITNGDLKATEIKSLAAGTFGISQNKTTKKYVRGVHTTEIILKAGTYTGSIDRSEEHTSELQSHSFISYAVFCLKKKIKI